MMVIILTILGKPNVPSKNSNHTSNFNNSKNFEGQSSSDNSGNFNNYKISNNNFENSSSSDNSRNFNNCKISNNNFENSSSSNNSSNFNNFDFSKIDMATIMKAKNIIDKINNSSDPRANLLESLKPFMRDSRKNKIDDYEKLINFVNIAEAFNSDKNKNI